MPQDLEAIDPLKPLGAHGTEHQSSFQTVSPIWWSAAAGRAKRTARAAVLSLHDARAADKTMRRSAVDGDFRGSRTSMIPAGSWISEQTGTNSGARGRRRRSSRFVVLRKTLTAVSQCRRKGLVSAPAPPEGPKRTIGSPV